MTRREQMLQDFDSLAAAELADLATTQTMEPARSLSTGAAVGMSTRRSTLGTWNWLLGAAVVGLIILAARR